MKELSGDYSPRRGQINTYIHLCTLLQLKILTGEAKRNAGNHSIVRTSRLLSTTLPLVPFILLISLYNGSPVILLNSNQHGAIKKVIVQGLKVRHIVHMEYQMHIVDIRHMQITSQNDPFNDKMTSCML